MNDDKNLEVVSDCVHEQWMEWSKSISKELFDVICILQTNLNGEENDSEMREAANNILKRLNRWNQLWVPYDELSEEMKDKDRKYARKILENLNRFYKILDEGDLLEIHNINKVYDDGGFDAVVNYAKVKLSDYGAVREENGLVKMATGGWSEHEDFIYCLNFITSKFLPHLRASTPGGGFYYSREKYDRNVKIMREED